MNVPWESTLVFKEASENPDPQETLGQLLKKSKRKKGSLNENSVTICKR
jgi:hypothetical protein